MAFSDRLLRDTGIRVTDILDHVEVPRSRRLESRLLSAGFMIKDDRMAVHTRGIFPDVVFGAARTTLAVSVESVADFLAANALSSEIEGDPHSPYRRAIAWSSEMADLIVVQRHGHKGFDVPMLPVPQLVASEFHLETLRKRRRRFPDIAAGFDETKTIVLHAISDLGRDWACALFLFAEREYWQRRNAAGRLQKSRQDVLGVGWANEDHHTYDCSREWFHRTVEILELLGFECRERFYAGADAGWGSQILEQPAVGSVVFADIDLSPDELTGDFAHARLDPLPKLRRAGLWCALHGESMLEAGLNHLECMFDSAALRAQLEAHGVQMMAPFSNFPHLYQELTVGERWPVEPERISRLQARGQISQAEAQEFLANGAVGSHFENLERNHGYKGFNQPGINEVLQRIDPRANLALHR